MHPTVLARRRALAEARLEEGLTALAERDGIDVPPATHARDTRVRDLQRLERLADVLDVLTGKAPQAPAADGGGSLRERLLDVRGVTPENVDEVLAELDRDSEEPLQDRLTAIDGIGPRTAEAIEEEIG